MRAAKWIGGVCGIWLGAHASLAQAQGPPPPPPELLRPDASSGPDAGAGDEPKPDAGAGDEPKPRAAPEPDASVGAPPTPSPAPAPSEPGASAAEEGSASPPSQAAPETEPEPAGAPAPPPSSPQVPPPPPSEPSPPPEPSAAASPSAPLSTDAARASESEGASEAGETAGVATPAAHAPALYIRLGAGLGLPFGSDISDDYGAAGADRISFSGQSLALDLMAGAQVLPWLAVGGGVVSDEIAAGTVENAEGEERDIERSLYFAALGAFVDVYPQPPAGLHLQALLGLARLSPSRDLGENTAVGFGAVLGVGYDVRASRRWNLGVLGRVAIAPMNMDAVGGQARSPDLFEPSLLVTATFRPEDPEDPPK